MSVSDHDIQAINIACSNQASLTFISGMNQGHGRFLKCSPAVIRIEAEDLLECPQAGSDICVTFLADTMTHAFWSVVAEVNPPEIVIHHPSSMITAESREAFRVPVVEGCPVNVSVSKGEHEWQAECINVSRSGMLIQCTEGSRTLELNDVVRIDYRFDNQVEGSLVGTIRRVQGGDSYGIGFEQLPAEHAVGNAAEFKKLIDLVEEFWQTQRPPESE